MVRDLLYEQLNTIYDDVYERNGIKCKNFDLCKTILPPTAYADGTNYLCMTCGDWFKIGGFGWNELEFRESEEECCVCLQTNMKQLKFPTNCGHWFCISCSRDILFWDETRYHLSPVPYGCPPCPNGCLNPEKGKQCHCEEYDIIQNTWELQHANDYKKWNDEEHQSIETSKEPEGSMFGSRKCPLCREKYAR